MGVASLLKREKGNASGKAELGHVSRGLTGPGAEALCTQNPAQALNSIETELLSKHPRKGILGGWVHALQGSLPSLPRAVGTASKITQPALQLKTHAAQ